jgi:hypothetical protein
MTNKPYNNGKWTEARMRAFVMSALRKAQWGVKYEAIKAAFVRDGINPATDRKCKLHECIDCGKLFPAKEMQADHIDPVVPLDGQWGDTTRFLGYNWNELIPRLFAEKEAFQALDKACHKIKSAQEKTLRAEHKRRAKLVGINDLFG